MLETDSIFALYAHVRSAGLYSVVPHSLLNQFESYQDVTAIPLLPELTRDVGIIMRRQGLLTPIQEAAWLTAQGLDLQQHFDSLITDSYQPIRQNN